ncbi:MAG: hypothetical protein V1929_00540 [bacterium]
MIGNPEEPKPGNALRLKKSEGGVPDGSGACVSCGAPMAADAVICVRCGFDKRSARHIRTERDVRRTPRRESHGGFLWSVLVFLVWVALLVGLSYALYEGYRYYEHHWTKKGGVGSVPKRNLCAGCRGEGKVKCPTCGGFGTVDAVFRTKCTQCGGTGRYTLMSKKSSTSCPFCRSKGYNETVGRENCKACAARGWVTCSRCMGRGRIN